MPIRRQLGITAFGINAYAAAAPGEPLIERHDETAAGAGGHQELYLMLEGAAAFRVDGDAVRLECGAMLVVEPGVEREAAVSEGPATVLVLGGRPGAVMPPSPFEYWYSAIPASESGDHDRAYEIVAEGLEHHPGHGTIHYVLGCERVLAGRHDEAIEHLRIAFERDPRTREWAASDEDLDALRGDPRFEAARG